MRCIHETKGVRCERQATHGCMCAECWAAEDARTAVTAAEREVVEFARAVRRIRSQRGAWYATFPAYMQAAEGLDIAVARLEAAEARLREVEG